MTHTHTHPTPSPHPGQRSQPSRAGSTLAVRDPEKSDKLSRATWWHGSDERTRVYTHVAATAPGPPCSAYPAVQLAAKGLPRDRYSPSAPARVRVGACGVAACSVSGHGRYAPQAARRDKQRLPVKLAKLRQTTWSQRHGTRACGTCWYSV